MDFTMDHHTYEKPRIPENYGKFSRSQASGVNWVNCEAREGGVGRVDISQIILKDPRLKKTIDCDFRK